MTRQQEQTELRELINSSGIYQAMALLEIKLKVYQQQDLVHNDRYSVLLEFESLNHELKTLRGKIESIVYQSQIWEKE